MAFSPLIVGYAVLGLVIGSLADRVAARWPAHEDRAVRSRDWRTVALALGGAAAFVALASRWSDPLDLGILSVYFAALLLLMATDLDQKLLPDVITLPLIVAALVLTLTGLNPLLADKELPIASALLAGIGAPLLLFALDVVVKGALGMGDLKLVAGLGLMSGVTRLFGGLVVASIASAVILIVLIAGRRLTMKTAIPFGPILILGGMLAALAP
ncbi:MAG TPA: A24 family peptidase [Candidatus Saccharimonadia bacterium]|nr:A24 family peptidase [Candidatus Saccharimonadia bacterium]